MRLAINVVVASLLALVIVVAIVACVQQGAGSSSGDTPTVIQCTVDNPCQNGVDGP